MDWCCCSVLTWRENFNYFINFNDFIMSMKIRTLLVGLMIPALGFAQEFQLKTQELSKPDNVPAPCHPVPHERQILWNETEFYAFFHYGMNTFTGKEWGFGDEAESIYAPKGMPNPEQWVTSVKAAGMNGGIAVVKHHDGFCLWPTKTTEHSVVHSPWREWQGDVVRELSEACRKHDMKFGFYLSPWDRNAVSYGDSPAYNALFITQLTELLTNYGRVDEVWLDGACGEGPNGKRQVYDWESILATINTLQPHAVTAIMGDDIRWVGNEGGRGRVTEWSATPYTPLSYKGGHKANSTLGLEEMSADLGSRELISRANGVYWYPSEVDVSIRPGWFYHEVENDAVRTLKNLVDIYYTSVGRNSVLLLNVPPDRRGLIHDIDAKRIEDFGRYIADNFSVSRISGTVRTWHAEAGDSREYKVKKGKRINTILLQEDIRRGQRVECFTVDAYIDGSWQIIAEGTTIGYKRLIRCEECEAERLRITINECRATANISNVAAYCATEIEE